MDSYQAAHDHFVSVIHQTEPPTPVGEEVGRDACDKRRQFSFFVGSELIRLASMIPGAGTDVGKPAELAIPIGGRPQIGLQQSQSQSVIFGPSILPADSAYFGA